MASDSNGFEYLHPVKRRKFSISSEIVQKCSEKSEIEILTRENDLSFTSLEDKNGEKELRIQTDNDDANPANTTPVSPSSDSNSNTNPSSKSSSPSSTSSKFPSSSRETSNNHLMFYEYYVNNIMNRSGLTFSCNQNLQSKYYDDDDDEDGDDDDDDDDEDYEDEDDENPIDREEGFDNLIKWVRKQINSDTQSSVLFPSSRLPQISDMLLWSMINRAISEPPRRMPLKNTNKIEDVLHLLKTCKNIVVLTGAGVSVSCGIPDFRSRDGIYSRLAIDYPNLPDPQAMFCISYFNKDPRPFFKFAREIFPGQFKPSPSHRFIRLLEKKNKLLRNYTQNIDTLEKICGIENVIECHGSFATATCTKCRYQVSSDAIREDIFQQKIPLCTICNPNTPSPCSSELSLDNSYETLVWRGIMKPDIVFFGEDLPENFHAAINDDRKKCDLLIVIGSSLKVRPVALIPSAIPNRVPQILINRELLTHLEFDVELLGNSDTVINHLCHLLGDEWSEICWEPELKLCDKISKVTPTVKTPLSSPKSNDGGDFQSSSSIQSYGDSGFDSSSNPATSSSITSSHSRLSSSCQITDSNSNLAPEDSVSNDNLIDGVITETATHQQALEKLKPVERHMSIDSAKDSGIGCSSSFSEDDKLSERKINLVDLLPPNTYFRNGTRCYVFPGAEIYYCSDDEDCDDENDIEDSGHFTQYDDDDSTNFENTLTNNEGNSSSSNSTENNDTKWDKCHFNLVAKDYKNC